MANLFTALADFVALIHLTYIALVCVESLTGTPCLLTELEDGLRLRAGEMTYGHDFIGYWTDHLIFHNAPQ